MNKTNDGIEVDCFICGSPRVVKGKCLDCGYECEVEFVCPLFNGSMSCRKTHKTCHRQLQFYDCKTYKKYGF